MGLVLISSDKKRLPGGCPAVAELPKGTVFDVYIDKSGKTIKGETKRQKTNLFILQGEAYIKKKEFDTATTYLRNAFDTSSVIHSDYNIGYIDRLCRQLSKSSYGKSPAVVMLARRVREYQEEQAKMLVKTSSV